MAMAITQEDEAFFFLYRRFIKIFCQVIRPFNQLIRDAELKPNDIQQVDTFLESIAQADPSLSRTQMVT
jgi:hypothetical protein